MASLLNFHMNEFKNSINDVEKKLDLVHSCVGEITRDYENAKESIVHAAQTQKIEKDRIEKAQNGLSDATFKECDELCESYLKLRGIIEEANHFRKLEQEFRTKFEQDYENFEEKKLKDLLNAKPKEKDLKNDSKFCQLKEMIENAKEGLSNEDLVMENADENVVHKCPITQKEISQPWKNPKCGHVYESEAITSYIKGRKNRKCPIAGCTENINFHMN